MPANTDIASVLKIKLMYNHPPGGGVKQNKMKQIKLEVGKTYVNREGKEVKIARKSDKGIWPYQGSNREWYTESGRWQYFGPEDPKDLIEEVPSETTRHTFTIPDGVKEITLDYFGNRIVVEMVPKKEPKPGDVMINEHGSVYIFKEVSGSGIHKHYARLEKDGRLTYNSVATPGRPATPEEAQPLFDALKKAGKRWDSETLQVEDVPEIDRILEWVETNIKDGYYNQEDVAEAIEGYLKHKEGEK